MVRKVFGVCLMCLTLAACSSEPSRLKVKEAANRIIPAFDVLEVKELKEVPGLYEVVLQSDTGPTVVYMDKKAKYLFSGSLMSIATKRNLTMETRKKYLQK